MARQGEAINRSVKARRQELGSVKAQVEAGFAFGERLKAAGVVNHPNGAAHANIPLMRNRCAQCQP